MLSTASKECLSMGKAMYCDGTEIVTIVSIHIISFELYQCFIRHSGRSTACSGSPASPLSQDLTSLKKEMWGEWLLFFQADLLIAECGMA